MRALRVAVLVSLIHAGAAALDPATFHQGLQKMIPERQGNPPGMWTIEPRVLVAGTTATIELRYRNGSASLPAGTAFRFDLEPLSVQRLVNTPISTGLGIRGIGRAPAPRVTIEPSPVNGVGYRPVRLVVEDGLKAGDGFALRIGNPNEKGEIIGLVNPVPVEDLSFGILTESPGKEAGLAAGAKGKAGRAGKKAKAAVARRRAADAVRGPGVDWWAMGWGEALPKVTITGARPDHLRLFAPSLAARDQPFRLRLAVTDAFDNRPAPHFAGAIRLECAGVSGLPEKIEVKETDGDHAVIENLRIAAPGFYRIKAALVAGVDSGRSMQVFESNPIVVRERVERPLYWGQLHNHNWYSECWGGPVADFYSFGRDFGGLDYLALTDHIGVLPRDAGLAGRLLRFRLGYAITGRDAWLDSLRETDKAYAPGVFCTLIACETGAGGSGHHNVFMADATEQNYPAMFMNPAQAVHSWQLRDRFRGQDILVLPHTHAAFFPYNDLEPDLNSRGGPIIPSIEAYSDWGSSFPDFTPEDLHPLTGRLRSADSISVREGIARGVHVGLHADSDCHAGLPGRRWPGAISPEHDHSQGVTACLADGLTRDGVIAGYRARRTYGTSGDHIFLEVKAGGVPAGQTLRTDETVKIEVEAAGTDVIAEIGLWDREGRIDKRDLGGAREGKVAFDLRAPDAGEEIPYFIEVIQANGHRAWSSPLWVAKASLPDLAWEKRDGKLRLVNRGKAAASRVRVVHADAGTPLAAPRIAPFMIAPARKEVGQVWTRRWNDHKVTVFFAWQGDPLPIEVAIAGAKAYRAEYDGALRNQSTIKDLGGGRVTVTPRRQSAKEWAGTLELTVEPSAREPSCVELKFEKAITCYLGDKPVESAAITVPVNGLGAGREINSLEIGNLAPGAAWLAPETRGAWTADPENALDELDEANNVTF